MTASDRFSYTDVPSSGEIFTQQFLEGFQWHGVKLGEAHDFYADDIRVEGPHPFLSSGGNNGTGRNRAVLYADSM